MSINSIWKLAVLLAPLSAFAADPSYYDAPLKGLFIQGLESQFPFTFEPGKLGKCTVSGSTGYTSFQCELTDAKLEIVTSKKTHVFTMKSMNGYENAGSASYPGTINQTFPATYELELPDGGKVNMTVNIQLNRRGDDPQKVEGNMYATATGFNGGLVARLPDPVVP